jgi:mono/diheme cytochrome c family protein
MRMRRLLKALGIGLGVLVGVFGLLQLIPYGRTHSNPPTLAEPKWDSPRTRELAKRACFDCHSNETNWPWYANVAPMSWAVQFDVDAAREIVNYSEFEREYPLGGYSGQRTRDGNMPPYKYMMAHPEAQLTPQEREELARGLDKTLRQGEFAER